MMTASARKIHKCADEMLMIGGEEEYQIAVELRTLAHRVSDSANDEPSHLTPASCAKI
jgi:hypothetical protein